MLGCVARGGERLQGEAAEVESVTVGQFGVSVLQAGSASSDDVRTEVGELPAAGHEVGVQVGLGHEPQP